MQMSNFGKVFAFVEISMGNIVNNTSNKSLAQFSMMMSYLLDCNWLEQNIVLRYLNGKYNVNHRVMNLLI